MTECRDIVVKQSNRLDKAIVLSMPELSRSQVQRIIDSGGVKIEGEINTKASSQITAGTKISVTEPRSPESNLIAKNIHLDIIFEDEETLVLNKPAGILVHPNKESEGTTLINAVRAQYPEISSLGNSDQGGIVHRLDRDTSGVIAFAKSAASHYLLQEQWRKRTTFKSYLAVVSGKLDHPKAKIETQLGTDPQDPRRQAVIEHGRSAKSEYKIIEEYGNEAALIEVQIYTGRTHQIRVHMSAIGNPIIGDTLYGTNSIYISRQALHAYRLGFSLPSNGEWREFLAQIPVDLIKLIENYRRIHETKPMLKLKEV